MSGLYHMSVQDIVITCSAHHILSHLHTYTPYERLFWNNTRKWDCLHYKYDKYVYKHSRNEWLIICVCKCVCLIWKDCRNEKQIYSRHFDPLKVRKRNSRQSVWKDPCVEETVKSSVTQELLFQSHQRKPPFTPASVKIAPDPAGKDLFSVPSGRLTDVISAIRYFVGKSSLLRAYYWN